MVSGEEPSVLGVAIFIAYEFIIMSLVAHSSLPTFQTLKERGQDVLTLSKARHQDIRELHIGLLNMMPDAAFRITEVQFIRLIGSCNRIVQFFVHPFTVPGLNRGKDIQQYIQQHYSSFEFLQKRGLDALIITGANVANPTLEQEPFWQPLSEVIQWAERNVISILCSCLATHAIVKQLYQISRQPLPQKLWGVFPHKVIQKDHILLRDINTRFDVPHSRYNTIPRETLEAAGLTLLVENQLGDIHMAVSPDQLKIVYLQGHPEYDANSLLKEYKREVHRFWSNERATYPPLPENYFSEDALAMVERYAQEVQAAQSQGDGLPPFPEKQITPYLDNTWGDTGKAIFNNWLGLVYQNADY